MSPLVTVAGAFVGFVVGLTGMGGGALMTPILVLLFGVEPLTAVSSDIVASMVMKPIGGGVHWRRGTVNKRMVFWLALGSIPSAFVGVLLIQKLGAGPQLQARVRLALGFALFIVSLGLVIRPLLTMRRGALPAAEQPPLAVRPLPTLLVGIIGGTVVGVTSVGSGSLIIVLLLIIYPRLKLAELVGTDLVQAVPLVSSAAIGHLLFGQFQLGLTTSILIGSIPGVFLGAHFSSRAPDHVIRPALLVVLSTSALKLLGVGNSAMLFVLPIAIALGVAYAIRTGRRARARARAVGAAPIAPAPSSTVEA